MKYRIAVLALLLVSVTACAPSVESSIPTPTASLTYGWVMVHHDHDWWVQIGPKSDGSGYHIAVQGWISCSYPTCGIYDFFKEYDVPDQAPGTQLVPGQAHGYRLWWNGSAWECHFRWDDNSPWRVIAVVQIGNASDYSTEINYSEKTPA